MTAIRTSITAKFLWTTGGYAASIGVRFLSSVVLARLLDPQILGIIVIAQAVRVGTELLTDVGIEQNVVSNRDGDQPRFLNTAWTLQLIRGLVVSLALAAVAPLLSSFYQVPVGVFLAVSLAPLINSLTSTSILSLSRNVDAKRRSIFEMTAEGAGLVINVSLALAMPTMWAPILGLLLGLAVRAIFSYMLPRQPHRLIWDKAYAMAIIRFGKWIMLASLGFYASMYLDRLYLGRVVSLAVLGVYGLARSIADLPLILASRLASQIIFPAIAANRNKSAASEHSELTKVRLLFLLLTALAMASVMSWSDVAIKILYDKRYHDAAWMLCLLLLNSWVGVLAFMGEAAALGHSKPHVVSVANVLRIAAIAICLPLGFWRFGLPGAILALPIGEVSRYLTIQVAAKKMGLSANLRQDVGATVFFLLVLGCWLLIRSALGLGLPWMLTA